MTLIDVLKSDTGKVIPDGKTTLNFVARCMKKPGKYWFVVVPQREIRSIQANAFYWAVIINPVAEYLSEQPEFVHNSFKHLFLGRETKQMVDFKTGELVEIEEPKSTTKLGKRAFFEYCEQCIQYATQEIGVDFDFEDYDTFIDNHPAEVEKYTHQFINDKTR